MAAVELDPDAQVFVDDQVAKGRYRDANAVVKAGLSRLEQDEADLRDRLAGIKASIESSLADPRPSIPADVVFGRLARKHAERMKERDAD